MSCFASVYFFGFVWGFLFYFSIQRANVMNLPVFSMEKSRNMMACRQTRWGGMLKITNHR